MCLTHAQKFTPRNIPNRNAFICAPKDVYKCAHRSLGHNSPNLKITQMAINKGMNN